MIVSMRCKLQMQWICHCTDPYVWPTTFLGSVFFSFKYFYCWCWCPFYFMAICLSRFFPLSLIMLYAFAILFTAIASLHKDCVHFASIYELVLVQRHTRHTPSRSTYSVPSIRICDGFCRLVLWKFILYKSILCYRLTYTNARIHKCHTSFGSLGLLVHIRFSRSTHSSAGVFVHTFAFSTKLNKWLCTNRWLAQKWRDVLEERCAYADWNET